MTEIKTGTRTKKIAPYQVVLWGPTNVGKSTLFNKLTGTRKAIVANRPGVTVDTHALLFDKEDVGFIKIIDSGGVGSGLTGHELKNEIEERAMRALVGAQMILFVADGSKPNPELSELAKRLRRRLEKNTKVVLVLNKVDRKDFNADSFHDLGFHSVIEISAEHGRGVEAIWDCVREDIPTFSQGTAMTSSDVAEENAEETPAEAVAPRVLILGRPNVGKSTLMNYLTKSNISAVSPVAGTTRDFISEKLVMGEDGSSFEVVLTDTAGLRRPGRRERDVEWVATHKIVDLSRRANVAVLVLDSDEGVTEQDSAIAGFAIDAGLSLVVALNKWDLVKESKQQEYKLAEIERSRDLKMAFLSWCPVVRISAKSGLGIKTLKENILLCARARETRVKTGELNSVFEKRIKDLSGMSTNSTVSSEKLYYMSQVSVNPPEFVLMCNLPPNRIHFSFRRYVTNVLREEFGFQGTPIRLHFKQH